MARTSRWALVALAVCLLAAGVGVIHLRDASVEGELRAARVAADNRNFPTAVHHLDRYLTARPDDLDVRLYAAQVARRKGDAAEHVKHLRGHEQRRGPEAARAFERKMLRVQEGDLADGQRLLDDPLATSSADRPLVFEAVVVGALRQLKKESGQQWKLPAGATDPRVVLARRAVDEWLAARPGRADQVQGLVWRGRVRAAAGDHPAAVADFRAALADDPGHTDARYHLAVTVLQSDPTTAVEMLHGLPTDDPAVPAALGAAYRTLGRLDDARSVLSAAVARRPDDLPLVLELGLVEVDAGRPADAEKWLRQVLEQAPNASAVHLALSRCMALAGKPDEARRFLDRHEQLEIAANRPWRLAHQGNQP